MVVKSSNFSLIFYVLNFAHKISSEESVLFEKKKRSFRKIKRLNAFICATLFLRTSCVPGPAMGTGGRGCPTVPAAVSALLLPPGLILLCLPSFLPEVPVTASGLSWAAAARSAREQGSVGTDTAGLVFNSQLGVGEKYCLVGATLRHALHLFPEVPIGNMTQSLVNTSCFGCLPSHLTFPIPCGCFLGSLPK